MAAMRKDRVCAPWQGSVVHSGSRLPGLESTGRVVAGIRCNGAAATESEPNMNRVDPHLGNAYVSVTGDIHECHGTWVRGYILGSKQRAIERRGITGLSRQRNRDLAKILAASGQNNANNSQAEQHSAPLRRLANTTDH